MKLNHRLLRARRLELGLTSRAVARHTKVSQTLIRRLETTGDASVLQLATLNTILEVLGLDLVDALEPSEPVRAPRGTAELIGALLQQRNAGIAPADISITLGLTLDEVNTGVAALDEQLRPAGLRVHHASSGICIVPAVDPEAGSGTTTERLRHLARITSSDMALIHRIICGRVPANTVASTNNGAVSLHRLEGAGLVHVVDNELRLTDVVAASLGTG
jgi:transcriptional regulator with XRE-family HTH domain